MQLIEGQMCVCVFFNKNNKIRIESASRGSNKDGRDVFLAVS